MKFEREATTKNGRRTWKVTYELVRGPEPKLKKTDKSPMNEPTRSAAKNAVEKTQPTKNSPQKVNAKQTRDGKKKKKSSPAQLGMF